MHPQAFYLCHWRSYLSMKLCMMWKETHYFYFVTCQSVFAEIYKYWECTCLVYDCTSESVPRSRFKTSYKTLQQSNDQQQATTLKTSYETSTPPMPRYGWVIKRIANAVQAATNGRRSEADSRGEALGSHG